MSIEILGYITDQNFLKELKVKTIEFSYHSNNSSASNEVTRMLNGLLEHCYAYPHYNKLYFVGNEDKLIESVEELSKKEDVIKSYSTEPEDTVLDPSVDSHALIIRILLYLGIKHNYGERIFRVPLRSKGNQGIYSKRCDALNPEVYCYYGLNTKLDSTHDGRAVLWVDMVSGAWREVEGRLVGPLSYPKMKELGVLAEFKRLSQPSPIERYSKTIEVIKNIFGRSEGFEVDMKTLGRIRFQRIDPYIRSRISSP